MKFNRFSKIKTKSTNLPFLFNGRLKFLFAIILICFLSSPLSAEVFYYKDDYGRIHISDKPQHKGYKKITLKSKKQIKITAERLPEAPPELYVVDDSKYSRIIYKEAVKHKIDPNLIRAIIKVESDFNPDCKSHAGAVGLMQLMPGTAKELGVTDSYNPFQNIRGGTEYIAKMLKMFDYDLSLALAAYNAGPGRVKRAGNTIPNIKETKNYVKKVNYYYSRFKKTITGTTSTGKLKQKGINYFKKGDTSKAIYYLKQAISKDPTDATNYYNIGFIYSRDGYYKKSITMYKNALSLNPYMKSAYYNLAITFERRGEYNSAISVWNNYINHESNKDKIESARLYIKELEKFKSGNKL